MKQLVKENDIIFNQTIGSLRERNRKLDTIFEPSVVIKSPTINGVRGYFGYIPQDRNFNSMVSTGAIEYIENKELFNLINTYYTTHSILLNDMAGQDEKNYNLITDHLNDKYYIKATRINEYTNGRNPLFLKRDSFYVYDYNIESLRGMKMDKKLFSILKYGNLKPSTKTKDIIKLAEEKRLTCLISFVRRDSNTRHVDISSLVFSL